MVHGSDQSSISRQSDANEMTDLVSGPISFVHPTGDSFVGSLSSQPNHHDGAVEMGHNGNGAGSLLQEEEMVSQLDDRSMMTDMDRPPGLTTFSPRKPVSKQSRRDDKVCTSISENHLDSPEKQQQQQKRQRNSSPCSKTGEEESIANPNPPMSLHGAPPKSKLHGAPSLENLMNNRLPRARLFGDDTLLENPPDVQRITQEPITHSSHFTIESSVAALEHPPHDVQHENQPHDARRVSTSPLGLNLSNSNIQHEGFSQHDAVPLPAGLQELSPIHHHNQGSHSANVFHGGENDESLQNQSPQLRPERSLAHEIDALLNQMRVAQILMTEYDFLNSKFLLLRDEDQDDPLLIHVVLELKKIQSQFCLQDAMQLLVKEEPTGHDVEKIKSDLEEFYIRLTRTYFSFFNINHQAYMLRYCDADEWSNNGHQQAPDITPNGSTSAPPGAARAYHLVLDDTVQSRTSSPARTSIIISKQNDQSRSDLTNPESIPGQGSDQVNVQRQTNRHAVIEQDSHLNDHTAPILCEQTHFTHANHNAQVNMSQDAGDLSKTGHQDSRDMESDRGSTSSAAGAAAMRSLCNVPEDMSNRKQVGMQLVVHRSSSTTNGQVLYSKSVSATVAVQNNIILPQSQQIPIAAACHHLPVEMSLMADYSRDDVDSSSNVGHEFWDDNSNDHNSIHSESMPVDSINVDSTGAAKGPCIIIQMMSHPMQQDMSLVEHQDAGDSSSIGGQGLDVHTCHPSVSAMTTSAALSVMTVELAAAVETVAAQPVLVQEVPSVPILSEQSPLMDSSNAVQVDMSIVGYQDDGDSPSSGGDLFGDQKQWNYPNPEYFLARPITIRKGEKISCSSMFQAPPVELTKQHSMVRVDTIDEDDGALYIRVPGKVLSNLRVQRGDILATFEATDQVNEVGSLFHIVIRGKELLDLITKPATDDYVIAVIRRHGNKLVHPNMTLYSSQDQIEMASIPTYDCRHQPVGVKNCGNTCYAGATLTLLAYGCHAFSQTVMNKSLLAKEGSWTRKLGSMYQCMLMENDDRLQVVPTMRMNALVRDLVVSLNDLALRGHDPIVYIPRKQQDAPEFLGRMLRKLTDEQWSHQGISPEERDRLESFGVEPPTEIQHIFEFSCQSQLQCPIPLCKHTSTTFEVMHQLEINLGHSSTLNEAIQSLLQPEILDQSNQWKCGGDDGPGCRMRVCATKTRTFVTAPFSLLVQLKRFEQDPLTGHWTKITQPMGFDIKLDFPLNDGTVVNYTLKGIIVHIGPSIKAGHYVSYVKKNKSWIQLDDDVVIHSREKEVLDQTRGVYELLYQQDFEDLEEWADFERPFSGDNASPCSSIVMPCEDDESPNADNASSCSSIEMPLEDDESPTEPTLPRSFLTKKTNSPFRAPQQPESAHLPSKEHPSLQFMSHLGLLPHRRLRRRQSSKMDEGYDASKENESSSGSDYELIDPESDDPHLEWCAPCDKHEIMKCQASIIVHEIQPNEQGSVPFPLLSKKREYVQNLCYNSFPDLQKQQIPGMARRIMKSVTKWDYFVQKSLPAIKEALPSPGILKDAEVELPSGMCAYDCLRTSSCQKQLGKDKISFCHALGLPPAQWYYLQKHLPDKTPKILNGDSINVKNGHEFQTLVYMSTDACTCLFHVEVCEDQHLLSNGGDAFFIEITPENPAHSSFLPVTAEGGLGRIGRYVSTDLDVPSHVGFIVHKISSQANPVTGKREWTRVDLREVTCSRTPPLRREEAANGNSSFDPPWSRSEQEGLVYSKTQVEDGSGKPDGPDDEPHGQLQRLRLGYQNPINAPESHMYTNGCRLEDRTSLFPNDAFERKSFDDEVHDKVCKDIVEHGKAHEGLCMLHVDRKIKNVHNLGAYCVQLDGNILYRVDLATNILQRVPKRSEIPTIMAHFEKSVLSKGATTETAVIHLVNMYKDWYKQECLYNTLAIHHIRLPTGYLGLLKQNIGNISTSQENTSMPLSQVLMSGHTRKYQGMILSTTPPSTKTPHGLAAIIPRATSTRVIAYDVLFPVEESSTHGLNVEHLESEQATIIKLFKTKGTIRDDYYRLPQNNKDRGRYHALSKFYRVRVSDEALMTTRQNKPLKLIPASQAIPNILALFQDDLEEGIKFPTLPSLVARFNEWSKYHHLEFHFWKGCTLTHWRAWFFEDQLSIFGVGSISKYKEKARANGTTTSSRKLNNQTSSPTPSPGDNDDSDSASSSNMPVTATATRPLSNKSNSSNNAQQKKKQPSVMPEQSSDSSVTMQQTAHLQEPEQLVPPNDARVVRPNSGMTASVTIAAGNAQASEATQPESSDFRSGRWTLDEEIIFLYALRKFGKGVWKKMMVYLPHRSLIQIKNHAQKIVKRMESGKNVFRRLEENSLLADALIAEIHADLGIAFSKKGEYSNLVQQHATKASSSRTLTSSHKTSRKTKKQKSAPGAHEPSKSATSSKKVTVRRMTRNSLKPNKKPTSALGDAKSPDINTPKASFNRKTSAPKPSTAARRTKSVNTRAKAMEPRPAVVARSERKRLSHSHTQTEVDYTVHNNVDEEGWELDEEGNRIEDPNVLVSYKRAVKKKQLSNEQDDEKSYKYSDDSDEDGDDEIESALSLSSKMTGGRPSSNSLKVKGNTTATVTSLPKKKKQKNKASSSRKLTSSVSGDGGPIESASSPMETELSNLVLPPGDDLDAFAMDLDAMVEANQEYEAHGKLEQRCFQQYLADLEDLKHHQV